MTLAQLAKKMADIDFAMLATRTEGGQLAERPMSNNGDFEYSGDSCFFTYESSRTATDITRDPQVSPSFTGAKGYWANRRCSSRCRERPTCCATGRRCRSTGCPTWRAGSRRASTRPGSC